MPFRVTVYASARIRDASVLQPAPHTAVAPADLLPPLAGESGVGGTAPIPRSYWVGAGAAALAEIGRDSRKNRLRRHHR